jgi:hypothetical protein
MRKMNCRSVRREIEEAPLGNLLSASAGDHLRDCSACSLFREDRLKLREMLSSLGAVEAPGDFDFRLRARLANEKRGAGQPFVMRTLSFSFRSAAVAATLLLIGSALLVVSLRTSSNVPLSATGAKSPSTTVDPSHANIQPADSQVAITSPSNVDGIKKPDGIKGPTELVKKVAVPRPFEGRRTEVATRGNRGVNPRIETLETGSTPAKVVRAGDPTNASSSNVFPIGASFQSLKVSLDDGRGSSRTISVPSVSFGSQRVLTPGTSSLLASARSDW